jgi:hypothetical protein
MKTYANGPSPTEFVLTEVVETEFDDDSCCGTVIFSLVQEIANRVMVTARKSCLIFIFFRFIFTKIRKNLTSQNFW